MSQNQVIRQQLEDEYGTEDMFKEAKIEEQLKKHKKIKSYKKFKEERKFKRSQLKTLEKLSTLHHLKHKSEGGETTKENGANINALAHMYMHSLPRQHEEIINNMLREFKLNIAELNNGKVEQAQQVEFDMSNCIEIPLEENEKEMEK